MWIDNPLAELFTEPLPQPRGGVIELPRVPGMGLALDKKKIAKYRLT
jgi:L-alanine-DL-glutamate epimerase-like enolase superfamily enzyme